MRPSILFFYVFLWGRGKSLQVLNVIVKRRHLKTFLIIFIKSTFQVHFCRLWNNGHTKFFLLLFCEFDIFLVQFTCVPFLVKQRPKKCTQISIIIGYSSEVSLVQSLRKWSEKLNFFTRLKCDKCTAIMQDVCRNDEMSNFRAQMSE